MDKEQAREYEYERGKALEIAAKICEEEAEWLMMQGTEEQRLANAAGIIMLLLSARRIRNMKTT